MNGHYFFDIRSSAVQVHAVPADGVYRYEISCMDGRVGYVEYNDKRECVAAEGVTPIDFDRRNLWGYWRYEDFVADYGDYHVDTGNMVFWPGWYTQDGYLITMWQGGKWWPPCIGNLGEVWVYDLIATPE